MFYHESKQRNKRTKPIASVKDIDCRWHVGARYACIKTEMTTKQPLVDNNAHKCTYTVRTYLFLFVSMPCAR